LEAVLPVDKSGRVYVVGSVPLLHAEAQTVREMLEGWRNQQLCRNLDHETIAGRIRIVERFLEVTNEFPWTWTAVMAEEFFSDLRSVRGRKQSTIRGYQNALRLFCSYVSHPDYGWDPHETLISLGAEPIPVPEPFAGMLKDHLNNRPNLRTGGGMAATPWLFPGYRPGKHLDTQTMLSALGISVLGARNSALRNLVAEIPPPVVANLLGYSHNCTQYHAERAGHRWSRYVT
jgi:hypothetical protein